MKDDKQYPISVKELNELLKSTVKVALNETDPIINDHIFALLLSKKPVQPLDRNNVEKIFNSPLVNDYKGECNITRLGKLKKEIIDKILQLIPQQNPEIEEVIGEYQSTVRELNKLNAENIKLKHQIKKQTIGTEDEIRKTVLKYSRVREFELKDGAKVGYRVLGIEQGEHMVAELASLAKPIGTKNEIKEWVNNKLVRWGDHTCILIGRPIDDDYEEQKDNFILELSSLAKPEQIDCYDKEGNIISNDNGEVIAEGTVNLMTYGYEIRGKTHKFVDDRIILREGKKIRLILIELKSQ